MTRSGIVARLSLTVSDVQRLLKWYWTRAGEVAALSGIEEPIKQEHKTIQYLHEVRLYGV